MNPETGKACTIDECIDYLIRLRDEYRNVCTAKLANAKPVQEKKSDARLAQSSTAKKSIAPAKGAVSAGVKARTDAKDKMSCEIASRDRTISALRSELSALKNSEAYRLGMFLSWPLRKTYRGIKCWRENGIKYTANRIGVKAKNLFLPGAKCRRTR